MCTRKSGFERMRTLIPIALLCLAFPSTPIVAGAEKLQANSDPVLQWEGGWKVGFQTKGNSRMYRAFGLASENGQITGLEDDKAFLRASSDVVSKWRDGARSADVTVIASRRFRLERSSSLEISRTLRGILKTDRPLVSSEKPDASVESNVQILALDGRIIESFESIKARLYDKRGGLLYFLEKLPGAVPAHQGTLKKTDSYGLGIGVYEVRITLKSTARTKEHKGAFDVRAKADFFNKPFPINNLRGQTIGRAGPLGLEVAVSATAADEPNLQGDGGILDALYGLENLEQVQNDVDEQWLNFGGGTATAKATYTWIDHKLQRLGRQFGYFRSDDAFKLIMEIVETEALDGKGLLTTRGRRTTALPPQEQVPALRWGIDGGWGDPLSSAAGENDGVDHMLTWLITGGPSRGNYVVAWEDGEDRDFNDLVVELSRVDPLAHTAVLPTTTPGEIDLLGERGALDDLYGLENLERVRDTDDQYWTTTGVGRAEAKGRFASDPARLEVLDGQNTRSTVLTVEGWGLNVTGDGKLVQSGAMTTLALGANGRYSSVPFQNPDGADHMTTWRVTQGPFAGSYVVAWEDQDRPGFDPDFQDMIIQISDAAPAAQVNVRIASIRTRTKHSPNEDTQRYPKGIFRVTGTFRNTSAEAILDPFFAIVELSGGNELRNSDSGPGGTILSIDANGDGIWSPGEVVDVTFEIGLRSTDRFWFFVDTFQR